MNGTWNFFDQTFSSLTLVQGDFTFTGPVYRRLSSFTALGTAHYYLTQSAGAALRRSSGSAAPGLNTSSRS